MLKGDLKELDFSLMIKLMTYNVDTVSYEKGINKINEASNKNNEIVGFHTWSDKENCFYTVHYRIKDKIKGS